MSLHDTPEIEEAISQSKRGLGFPSYVRPDSNFSFRALPSEQMAEVVRMLTSKKEGILSTTEGIFKYANEIEQDKNVGRLLVYMEKIMSVYGEIRKLSLRMLDCSKALYDGDATHFFMKSSSNEAEGVSSTDLKKIKTGIREAERKLNAIGAALGPDSGVTDPQKILLNMLISTLSNIGDCYQYFVDWSTNNRPRLNIPDERQQVVKNWAYLKTNVFEPVDDNAQQLAGAVAGCLKNFGLNKVDQGGENELTPQPMSVPVGPVDISDAAYSQTLAVESVQSVQSIAPETLRSGVASRENFDIVDSGSDKIGVAGDEIRKKLFKVLGGAVFVGGIAAAAAAIYSHFGPFGAKETTGVVQGASLNPNVLEHGESSSKIEVTPGTPVVEANITVPATSASAKPISAGSAASASMGLKGTKLDLPKDGLPAAGLSAAAVSSGVPVAPAGSGDLVDPWANSSAGVPEVKGAKFGRKPAALPTKPSTEEED